MKVIKFLFLVFYVICFALSAKKVSKKQDLTDKEQIKQQLNQVLTPKYEYLVETRQKMENEGLTEEELRQLIKTVPELKFLNGYVDDLMKNQKDGKLQFNN